MAKHQKSKRLVFSTKDYIKAVTASGKRVDTYTPYHYAADVMEKYQSFALVHASLSHMDCFIVLEQGNAD